MTSAREYHRRTKHQFGAYARGPETLDWDDQPDPFRRFEGSPVFKLPSPGQDLPMTWSTLTSQQAKQAAEINLENLGRMLELAFGLAAWKEYGPDRWSVRCNPSSGNLHPSEAYIINTVNDLLPQGIYHYVSNDHHLEQRCLFNAAGLSEGLWLGLTSVHWREAWKYGERAFRYCQLDAGHALGALTYAAALMGWQISRCHDVNDRQIAHILGIDRTDDFVNKEEESPDWLYQIQYAREPAPSLTSDLLTAVDQGEWYGKAQSLKAYHMYHWKVIDDITRHTVRNNEKKPETTHTNTDTEVSTCRHKASALIRQRRSAQQYQANAKPVSAKTFNHLLAATMPHDQLPFSGWDLGTAIHLFLFVHQVEGLASGLYCLPRSAEGKALLQQTLNQTFLWQTQQDFPELYLLQKGDSRRLAKSLSCHQAIAADSAFSLGMLAEFDHHLSIAEWHYRRLFWECGLIGQALYMEAEAEGLRGTGIGCFFDDEVHQLLGLTSDKLQSLYHFTIGLPVEDDRIQTLPAYAHLDNSSRDY